MKLDELSRRSQSTVSRRSSVRRARARRRSDGAVMFIVVVTLGLLAAMGVYGLSAASSEIKSAGHMREALQGQRAGESGLTMTAETLSPAAARVLVESMSGVNRTKDCKTASGDTPGVPASVQPFTTSTKIPATAACKRLKESDMRIVAGSLTDPVANGGLPPINPWLTTGFAVDSFGHVTVKPEVEIELSNPLDMPPPPGSGYDPATIRFTQVTATVFVNLRKTATVPGDAPTVPSDSVVVGRGRLTIGPITGSAKAF